jgi:hypothetical protein
VPRSAKKGPHIGQRGEREIKREGGRERERERERETEKDDGRFKRNDRCLGTF